MAELPKNLREFLARDLIYIVGGSSVIVSFLYRFDRIPDSSTPIAFYMLGAGLGYVVGYALQDLFSILRLVTTAQVTKPNRLLRWAYARFAGEPWEELPPLKSNEIGPGLRRFLNDDFTRARYERSITHMMVGTTIGPCILLSSFLIFWRWLVGRSQFDLVLSIVSLVLSVVLFLLSWIKAMQVTRIDARAVADRQAASEKDT